MEVKIMENEMLNKILEEVKSLRTEMNERFEAVDKKFEEMDNKFERKFEEMDNKFEREFEDLNDKFEKHLIEFAEFKEEFRRHDEGVKKAWEKFENVIGEEFNKVHSRLDKISFKIKFLEIGMQEIYLIHNKKFNLAEDDEHYKLFTNKE